MTTQEKREKLREMLNSAEIAEIRHALVSRVHELVRLKQDTEALGVESAVISAHLYVINGESGVPGLIDLVSQEDWQDPAQVTAEFAPPAGQSVVSKQKEAHLEDFPPQKPFTGTEEEAQELGSPEFIPTLEQIEEAREWLTEEGWEGWEHKLPDAEAPLHRTILLIDDHGWTRAMEMAKEAHGEPEKAEEGEGRQDAGLVPHKGDVVKIPAKGRGRNPVFRVHAITDGVVVLENARGKELRPVLAVDGLKWEPDKTAWLLTYEMDASEFLTIKEFIKLREERDLPPEEDLPRPAETAVSVPETPAEEPSDEEAGARPAGLEVGDPLVVMDGEELSICLVGPVSVMPPHWLRVLDPEQPSGDPHLEGKELGRVQAGALEWDDELDAWSVGKSAVRWTEEEAQVERA